MKKTIALILTVFIITTMLPMVSFCSTSPTYDLYLDMKAITCNATKGNDFEIVLFTDEAPDNLYCFQTQIYFDKNYFNAISSELNVADAYKGLDVIDNENGLYTFSAYTNGVSPTPDYNNRYILATFTFHALNTITANSAFGFSENKTELLDENASPIDFNTTNFVLLIPQQPVLTSPNSTYFRYGEYISFACYTQNSTMQYSFSSDLEDLTDYSQPIKLTRNVTYYVVGKKYGILGPVATFKMSMYQTYTNTTDTSSGSGNSSQNTTSTYVPPTVSTVNNTPTTNYSDISGHWAETYINKLINKGIINGYDDKTIKPDNTITRAEIAKMIVTAIGKGEATDINLNFTDNDSIEKWAKGYIQTAVNLGILKGYDDGSFMPNKPVTRSELAKIAMIAFNLGSLDSVDVNFSDASSIEAWAKGYISKAVAENIITGYEDGTFMPNKEVTRCEACAIISKCLK